MTRLSFLAGIGFVFAWFAQGQTAKGQTVPTQTSLPAQRAVIDQYCVTCHNQKLKTAGLQLDKMDLAHVGEQAEAWEKVVRKLRAGMMPPSGLPRPAPAAC